eukprot:XP_017456949.1 PREDICTED: involucrin-like [Rattus norvegicus]
MSVLCRDQSACNGDQLRYSARCHCCFSCQLDTPKGPSCQLDIPEGPSCQLDTPEGPSCQLDTPEGPSCQLDTPKGPSCQLDIPEGPSCQLDIPERPSMRNCLRDQHTQLIEQSWEDVAVVDVPCLFTRQQYSLPSRERQGVQSLGAQSLGV